MADLARSLLNCATTDAALELLGTANLLRKTMAELGRRIQDTLVRWTPEGAQIGFVCFSDREPCNRALAKSRNADELVRRLK